MTESLIITIVIAVVGARILFTPHFWFIVGGVITLGITGYLLFWIWIFVVAMMAMA